jgi:hypothetical protein
MWSYIPLEQRIPEDHPLRPIRQMVDRVLREMSPEFDGLYSKVGRQGAPHKASHAMNGRPAGQARRQVPVQPPAGFVRSDLAS